MSNQTLRDTLLFQPKHGYDRLTEAQRAEMESYCKDYAAFMDAAKTEREAVTYTVAAAERAGFRPLTPGMSLKPGDKVYRNNRGKSILLAVIGEESLNAGMNICAAHIDSPRLDVKPNPLYEDSEIAYLKTHYYGGIKKYQWTTVPLALHGVIYKKNGEVLTVTVGESDTDPVLCVSDLLVHLSADQMKKTLAEGITGEQLNVILGTVPLPDDEGADRVKLAILNLLHEKYGIIEEDFLSAELTIVPAGKCREVGLDRSLLGAYGHDDRVCSFAALAPLLACGKGNAHQGQGHQAPGCQTGGPMCFLHMYVLRLGSGAARRGGPVLPFLNHGVRMQAEADRDGQIDLLHHILLHMAHLFPQALFVQGAHLLQQDHRVLGQAAAHGGQGDVGGEAGLSGLRGDGCGDDCGAVPVAGVILDDQNGPHAPLLTAHDGAEVGIKNVASFHTVIHVSSHSAGK